MYTIDQSKSTVQIQNLNANVNATSLNTIETSVTIPTDSIEINASITALYYKLSRSNTCSDRD